MIIIVMRHGQSEADLMNVYEGRADFLLTKKGIEQVNETANILFSKYLITKIYASPLKRTKMTANIINYYYHLDITYLEDLMEFNNGILAGVDRNVANEKYPKVDNLPYDQAVYGMESMKNFRDRAEKALTMILCNGLEEDVILVVSHGGLINQLYQAFKELPYQSVTRYQTGDAQYHIWKIENGLRKVMDDIEKNN